MPRAGRGQRVVGSPRTPMCRGEGAGGGDRSDHAYLYLAGIRFGEGAAFSSVLGRQLQSPMKAGADAPPVAADGGSVPHTNGPVRFVERAEARMRESLARRTAIATWPVPYAPIPWPSPAMTPRNSARPLSRPMAG